jgi:hypothetical protein
MALALSMLEMQPDNDLHAGTAGQAHVGQLQGFRGDALDVVERGALGDVLDGIEDVVHGVDEAVDLVAIEGGDEALVELGDGFVGDLVGGLFDGLDGADVLLCAGQILHQGDQSLTAEDNLLRMGVEEFKKTALMGQQASEHGFCGNQMTVMFHFNRGVPAPRADTRQL